MFGLITVKHPKLELQFQYLNPKEEFPTWRLKLQDVHTPGGALGHSFKFTVIRKDDKVLKMKNILNDMLMSCLQLQQATKNCLQTLRSSLLILKVDD